MCGALLTLGQAYVFPSVSTTFRGIWIFIWQLKRHAWNCDLATVLGKGLLIDRHMLWTTSKLGLPICRNLKMNNTFFPIFATICSCCSATCAQSKINCRHRLFMQPCILHDLAKHGCSLAPASPSQWPSPLQKSKDIPAKKLVPRDYKFIVPQILEL